MEKNKPHNNKEYKLIHIVIGLTIGFFMGALIVYNLFNRQNVRDLYTNSIISLTHSGQKNENDITTGQNAKTINYDIINKKSNNTILNKEKKSRINNLSKEGPEGEYKSYYPPVEYSQVNNKKEERNISLNNEKSNNFLKNNKKDTEIVKNEHIFTKIFTNPRPKKTDNSTTYQIIDSIISKPTYSDQQKNLLLVEFWNSPLKTKGYKKGKNNLILYGIELYDFVSLKHYDEVLYLKYLNQFYPLGLTTEFKSLKPISDMKLIEKLQQL